MKVFSKNVKQVKHKILPKEHATVFICSLNFTLFVQFVQSRSQGPLFFSALVGEQERTWERGWHARSKEESC